MKDNSKFKNYKSELEYEGQPRFNPLHLGTQSIARSDPWAQSGRTEHGWVWPPNRTKQKSELPRSTKSQSTERKGHRATRQAAAPPRPQTADFRRTSLHPPQLLKTKAGTRAGSQGGDVPETILGPASRASARQARPRSPGACRAPSAGTPSPGWGRLSGALCVLSSALQKRKQHN